MAYTTPIRAPLTLLVILLSMGVVFHFIRQRPGIPSDRTPTPDPCRGVISDACRAVDLVDPVSGTVTQTWQRRSQGRSSGLRTCASGWVRSLGGNRLGHTGTRWTEAGEEFKVEVTSFQLTTHFPSGPNLEIPPGQLQLIAAHEMGHVLGLPHSDDPRDVMFPQNTAWRRTRRDFETMEALYRLPNGAIIQK